MTEQTDFQKAKEAAAFAMQNRDDSFVAGEPLDPSFLDDIDAALSALEREGWVCVPQYSDGAVQAWVSDATFFLHRLWVLMPNAKAEGITTVHELFNRAHGLLLSKTLKHKDGQP